MPKLVVSETIHIEGGEVYLHERPDLPGIETGLVTVLAGEVEILERGSTTILTPPTAKAVKVRWPVSIKALTNAIVLAEYTAHHD